MEFSVLTHPIKHTNTLELNNMEFIFCKKCYETVENTNQQAAYLWLTLCEKFISARDNLRIVEQKHKHEVPLLNCLERMGFISTVDGKDSIVLRVNGYGILNDEDSNDCLECFCNDRKGHKHESSEINGL